MQAPQFSLLNELSIDKTVMGSFQEEQCVGLTIVPTVNCEYFVSKILRAIIFRVKQFSDK